LKNAGADEHPGVSRISRGLNASWPSLKTDLRNAGAEWLDPEAVVDHNPVSSRKADDIPAFNRAMIDVFSGSRAKARHATL
jgi:protease I